MAVGRQSTSVIKVGVAYMGIHVLRCLNEELTWIIKSFKLLVILS